MCIRDSGICVTDMEKCAAFYEEVLGLQKVYDDEMEGKLSLIHILPLTERMPIT